MICVPFRGQCAVAIRKRVGLHTRPCGAPNLVICLRNLVTTMRHRIAPDTSSIDSLMGTLHNVVGMLFGVRGPVAAASRM